MLIQSNPQQNKSINFKSHDFKTTCLNQAGQNQVFNHYTYLGRDLEESFLLRDLIQQTFPNGTTILNPACSTGAESRTIAMLLENDPKYPIIASDISSEAIESAQKGAYPIARHHVENGITYPDSYLNHNTQIEKIENPLERVFRTLFEQHFQLTTTQAAQKTSASSYDTYASSDNIRRNITFSVEDVEKIDETQKAGVIIYKNAWSYLFGNEKGEVRLDNNAEQIFSKVSSVVKKFAKILPQKGILSAGNCPYDYFVADRANKMVTPPPLTDILQRNGFEAINESAQQISLKGFSIKIPTLWRKV